MQVYVTDDYTEGVSLRNAFLEENRRVSATLRNNQFTLVEKHKIQADKLKKTDGTKIHPV